MKQWRKEARKHNDEATATALKHGDIQPGQRVGLVNKQMPQV